MTLLRKASYCFLIYILLNIISLPAIFLIGGFKDGLIAMQQEFVTIIITIAVLLFLFHIMKIRKTRYAIVVSFLIQYLFVFQGKIFPSDPLMAEGFFIASYLLNPISFYVFRLSGLIFIISSLLLKFIPSVAPFNLLIVSILILVFNIFCWYILGLLIERVLSSRVEDKAH